MWKFEETPVMGGPTGEGFRNTLNASGFEKEEVLAREAIQNSVDAHDESGDIVSITFRQIQLQGEDLKSFNAGLNLTEAYKPREDYIDAGVGDALRNLDDQESSFQNLLIEDRNTVGLSGSLSRTNSKSHFRNLLLELGFGGKARQNDVSGGSYGFGKSVYSSNSSIRTILAYSRFNPCEETNGAYARFMGCAYFEAHEYNEASYTGRAWFGHEVDERTVMPFQDEDADEIAGKLGMPVRQNDENGTSILIVGTDFDMERLKHSIEDYWWPRLIDHDLDVELWQNDVELDPPRPRIRMELKPFITSYEIATGKVEASGDLQKRTQLQRYQDKHPGVMANIALKYDDESDEEENQDSKFINSLAQLRSTKMIVEYRKCGLPNLEPACGTYIGHPDIERTLKLSEPGLHNCWDPNSERLDENQSQVVLRVISKSQDNFRNFQRGLRPPPPKTDGRLRDLERLIGGFSKTKNPTPPPPPPPVEADPFSITFHERNRIVENSMAIERGRIEVGMKDNYGEEDLNIAVKVTGHVLFDDQLVMGDKLEMKIAIEEGEATKEESMILCNIGSNKTVLLQYESIPYDTSWICQVEVNVESQNG